MIGLKSILDDFGLYEADDDKYVSIGFGRFKLKGKEDDDDADVYVKTDSGKYEKSADQSSDDKDAKDDKPNPKKAMGIDKSGGFGDDEDDDDMDDDEEKSAESENEKIISALEDMDLPDGFNVDSLDSAIDSGQYASITGKDDDPDNEMNVNAFTGEDGKVEYGINIGSGHDMIYFNSKEEAIEATEKLLDDATIRDAMNGESDPAGVTLADLGDHAKNVLKSDDDESKPIPAAPMETKVINGVKYRAIKESKKPKKHILKENYDRFFGDK